MAVTLLTKAAISIGTSKPGRKIIGIVAGCILVLILMIISIFLGMISIFMGSGKINSDFNAQETEVYQVIRSMYDEYTAEQKRQMELLEEKYTEENMDSRTITVYNPETHMDEEEEEEFCTVEISVTKYQYISTACAMAYLSCTHKADYLKSEEITIDEDEVIAFWDRVGGKVEVTFDEEKDPPEYFIFNSPMSVEEIAEEYFISASLQKEYMESVYLISQYVGIEVFEPLEGIIENRMDIPLYYQYAPEWGQVAYGNGTIAKNGCATACVAMVLSYLKGERIRPDHVVSFTGNRYYINGAGSSWDIFPACAQHWGVECTYVGKSADQILSVLSEGKPVVMSMGPGTFTSSGHFIVLTGVTENGMVTVNDPNDNAKKNHIGRVFSIQQIIREAKGGWSFE